MSTQPRPEPPANGHTEHALEQEITQLEERSLTDTEATGTRTDARWFWRWAVFVACLTLAIFHVYTSPVFVGSLPRLQQGAFHLGLGLFLVFLIFPAKPRTTRLRRWYGLALTGTGVLLLPYLVLVGIAEWYVVLPAFGVLVLVQAARYLPWTLLGVPYADIALAALGLFCGLYVFVNYEQIVLMGASLDDANTAVGAVGLLLVLVAAQRCLGSALVILAGLMLAYGYYGPLLPGFLHHGGYSIDRIITHSFFTDEAVFGTPIWVSATVIFLFLVFAAMLQRTGMERFFTDLALGSTGWATGGTGKVSVVTSAFTGTITGSSVANTVSNGAFTIPMMRTSGYKRDYAGAVEAASSTGGQITPPIMGAAAFIMVEITGVPYIEILKAAIVPAILFFVGQFVVIHFDSKKFGISGMPKSMLPSVRRLMSGRGYLFIPIAAIFVLLSLGFSPSFAAMGAIGVAVGINLFVQLLAPLVAMMPRPHERVDADSALGTSGASRLLGAVLIVAAMAGVAFVAWVAYQALGALAPELALVYRVVIVSVGIGVLVALLGQAVTRRWGRHVDDSVISGSMRANLTATGRLAIPFVAAFAVLWAFTEALNRIAPGLDRVWTVATVALGLAVLAVPLTAAFQRWRSQTADKLSLATLAEGLAGATRIALPIIIACGAAGMIVGIITLTGLGHELAAGLVSLGQGYLVPVMFLSMLACLVLGIGLPTTANYVITATLAAPAILLILQGDLDEPTMAMLLMAHLFVYYFGVMADITPPVCLAAYAACGISGGNPIRTGVQAVRIAVSGFVVPFMFVLNPELLLQNVTWLEGFTAALSAAAGASLVGIAVTGYLHRRINWLQRLVLAGCGLLLLQVGWLFDALGIAIAAAVIGLHRWRARHAERASEPVSLDAA